MGARAAPNGKTLATRGHNEASNNTALAHTARNLPASQPYGWECPCHAYHTYHTPCLPHTQVAIAVTQPGDGPAASAHTWKLEHTSRLPYTPLDKSRA